MKSSGTRRGRFLVFGAAGSADLFTRQSPEQIKRAPDLESRDPALAIECIHKQQNHIPSTLATKSQKSRWNVLDVDADAVPAQRVRRVDRGNGTTLTGSRSTGWLW